MPIDVEFGVLIRISQIPDRVRKPRIRSPEGFLEESTHNPDLECTSNGTSDGIWNLIISVESPEFRPFEVKGQKYRCGILGPFEVQPFEVPKTIREGCSFA